MPRKLELAVEVIEDPKGFASSIQQVEQLEGRVIALTKDTVELRKAKQGVEAQLRQFNQRIAEGAKFTQEEAKQLEALTLRNTELGNSLQRSTFAQRTARQELTNLNFAQRDAAQQAQLLAAQFGVNLPHGMTTLITRSEGVQRALAGAFNISVITAFGVAGVAAIAALGREIFQLQDALLRLPETFRAGGLEAVFEPLKERIANFYGIETEEMSRRRVGAVRAGAVTRAIGLEREAQGIGLSEIERLRRELDDLRSRGVGGGLPEQQREQAAKIALAQAKLTEAIRKENEKRVELERAAQHTIVGINLQANAERLDEHGKALAGIYQQEQTQLEQTRKLLDDGLISTQQFEETRTNIRAAGAAKRQALEDKEAEDRAKRERALEAELEELDQQRAEARLTRLAEENEKETRLREQQAEEQRRAMKQYANDLESLFDRTIGSARSAKEAIANIWRELAREWKHQIFQQIAQATFPGVRGQGTAASAATGLGGLIPGIFGGIQTGPGGTPPFLPATQQFVGGGFAAGTQALTGAGAISPAAVGTQTRPTLAAGLGLPATTPIGDLLGKIFSHGAGPVSGGQLATLGLALGSMTVGNRNRLISTLGGLGSGALLGFSVGGPIGAAIGAIAGGLIGLFSGGGGKQKRQDTAIENAGFAQIKQLLEDYERHRRDFGTTFDSMFQIWERMEQQFVRPESKRDAKRNFDLYISRIRSIEDERNRRRQLMELLPVPSFQDGGIVSGERGMGAYSLFATHYSRRGMVPALLHPGEFVMNQKAVQRWGTSLLEGLNRGSAPGAASSGGGYTMMIWVPSKEFAAKIVEEGIPVVVGKGGRASRILRG